MNIRHHPWIKAFFTTGREIRKHPHLFLPLIFSDLLFIVIFGRFVWKYIADKLFVLIGDILVLISRSQQDMSLSALMSGANALRNIQYTTEIRELIGHVYRYLLLFWFLILVLWLVFQGFNYYWTKRMLKEKMSLSLFIRQFLLDNTIYFLLMLLIIVVFGKLSVLIRIGIWQKSILAIGLILLIYVVHMWLITPAFMGKEKHLIRKAFRRGFDFHYIPMWIVIVLFIIALDLILKLLSFNQGVLIVSGIVLLLPAFGLIRLYILETTNEIRLLEMNEKKR